MLLFISEIYFVFMYYYIFTEKVGWLCPIHLLVLVINLQTF